MNIPLSEMMKSIPGAFGIRLEEELPYTVIRELGDIELRHYPGFTLARVEHEGTFEEAKEASFTDLAEFIFGDNQQQEQSFMTTPIFLDRNSGERWTMSFYVPPESTQLIPMNPSIRVEEMPEKIVAVYRYSGNNTLEKMEQARDFLLRALEENDITSTSEVWWAQYDQPISIPLLKRNEAFVKVEL